MWRTLCCLSIALMLAIIGVSIDVLMADSGSAYYDTVSISLYYGWNDMSWIILVGDGYYTQNPVEYSHAYSRYCNETIIDNRGFCVDLKNVKDAGQVYIIFNIIGIIILSVALVVTGLGLMGKFMCSYYCRLKWIVSILCAMAVVCLSLAFGSFLAGFSKDTNQLIEAMTPYSAVDWNGPRIGASIGLLIAASSIGFITLTCILWLDRGWEKAPNYQLLSGSDGSTLCPFFFSSEPPLVAPIQNVGANSGPYYQEGQYNNSTIPV